MKDKKWLGFFALLAAFGCVGAVMVLTQGHGVLGTSQFVTWGILISSYEFFAASSTGVCLIIAFGFLRGIEPLAGLIKPMLILAVALMAGGFSIIGLELGAPLHTINLMLNPNLSSPIYWMMVLYGAYMALLLGTLFFVVKKHEAMSRKFAILAFFIAIVATGNMGALLGFVEARPFWYGSFLPVYFIITAMLSGTAIMITALYLKEGKDSAAIPRLSKLFSLLLISTIVLVVFKMGSALFGSSPGKYAAAMALLTGPLSINFWVFEVIVGLIVPVILLLTAQGRSGRILTAGLMTIIGVFAMRYDLVIAGQMIPIEVVNVPIPLPGWVYHQYSPSFAEWSIVALGFGLAGFAYILGERMLYRDNTSKQTAIKGTL